jgi:lysine 2,3-aminomutase
LADGGIPLGSQTVLLKGINDTPEVMKKLMHDLLKIRVRPYYIYQCDPIEGSRHFRTPVSSGIKIMEQLRGFTSGYAVPTYVVDAPGGGGKIPLQPNYVLSQGPDKVILRNFEGFVTTYAEPKDYDPDEIRTQEALIEPRPEPGQEGIYGLLEGRRMSIEPQGFAEVHARGGAEHRLRSGDLAQKWQPLGIGALEGEKLSGEEERASQALPAGDEETEE